MHSTVREAVSQAMAEAAVTRALPGVQVFRDREGFRALPLPFEATDLRDRITDMRGSPSAITSGSRVRGFEFPTRAAEFHQHGHRIDPGLEIAVIVGAEAIVTAGLGRGLAADMASDIRGGSDIHT